MTGNGNGTVHPLPASPPLSARERDQQRKRLIAHVQAVTSQVNTLSRVVDSLRLESRPDLSNSVLSEFDRALLLSVERLNARVEALERPFWQRLRWIVTGR